MDTIIRINGKLTKVTVFECYLDEQDINCHLQQVEKDNDVLNVCTSNNSSDIYNSYIVNYQDVYNMGTKYCNAITEHVLRNADSLTLNDISIIEKEIPAYMRYDQRTDYTKPCFSHLYDTYITQETIEYNYSLS